MYTTEEIDMKTNEEIREEAYAIAYGHFHCEDGEAWEPFENYSAEEIAEEVEMMTDIIARAMRWAQE
jgi:formylmethanofuran dehydrogenase subunit A